MAKDSQILAKKIELEVNGSKVQVIGDKSLVNLKKGDKVKLIKKNENGYEDLVVFKDGETLVITYADGSTITVDGFYALEDVTLELPVAQNELHILSSNYDVETAQTTVVYAQGDMSKFNSLFEGKDSFTTAMNDYSSISETGLNAGAETAATATGVAGTGLSTAALVAGGVLVAGGIAVAASGSSGGGSNSSSSTDSSQTGYLVDAAIGGADYYINGVYAGKTAADGSFKYSAGDVIEFRIGNIILGRMDAADVPSDDIIMIQDIVGVDRTDVTDPVVLAIARILQTFSNEAGTAITIPENVEDIITNDIDFAEIIENYDPQNQSLEVNNLEGIVDGIVPVGDYTVPTPVEATTHLINTLKNISDESSSADALLLARLHVAAEDALHDFLNISNEQLSTEILNEAANELLAAVVTAQATANLTDAVALRATATTDAAAVVTAQATATASAAAATAAEAADAAVLTAQAAQANFAKLIETLDNVLDATMYTTITGNINDLDYVSQYLSLQDDVNFVVKSQYIHDEYLIQIPSNALNLLSLETTGTITLGEARIYGTAENIIDMFAKENIQFGQKPDLDISSSITQVQLDELTPLSGEITIGSGGLIGTSGEDHIEFVELSGLISNSSSEYYDSSYNGLDYNIGSLSSVDLKGGGADNIAVEAESILALGGSLTVRLDELDTINVADGSELGNENITGDIARWTSGSTNPTSGAGTYTFTQTVNDELVTLNVIVETIIP